MEADERRKWTLLSSHGHVLVEIARNPRARVRDISAIIGITERATQAIIADLERAGYVERVRIGRRTHYVLHPDNPFRHSAQSGMQVGPFLDLLTATSEMGGPIGPPPAETFLAAAAATAGAGMGTDALSTETTAEAIPLPPLPLALPLLPPATEGGAAPATARVDMPDPGVG